VSLVGAFPASAVVAQSLAAGKSLVALVVDLEVVVAVVESVPHSAEATFLYVALMKVT